MRTYSVVICSFNKQNSVKKVAEKVKKLRSETELILADDFSTDGTVNWAKASGLFSHIHVESEPGNYRLNTIRNCGISLATNQYVVLLDGDCVPNELYFDGYDEVFDKFPNAIGIGITEKYDSVGIKLKEQDPRWCFYKENSIEKTGWENFYGGNVAFPKPLWEISKFDDVYNGYWGFEDLDFSYRLSKIGIHFYFSFVSSVNHLEHPFCKQSKEAHEVYCRNRELFESRYKLKFNKAPNVKSVYNISVGSKKILICKNIKSLRNGGKNPKDYPYWDELVSLLKDHDVKFVEGEIPLTDLKNMILDCDIWVAPDSFFQHFAWSLGKVGITIFSITDPLIFGHSENVNILKDRSYLRSNQFLWMESEIYNPEAFLSAQDVFEIISKTITNA